MKWINDNTEAKWFMIEKELAPFSIKTLPFLDKKDITQMKGQNRWINSILYICEQICKKHKLDNELLYLREMAWNPQFKPNQMDNILKVWSSKGLQIYSQLLLKNELNSFEAISNRFNLAQSNFYKYLQLRNYISNLHKREGKQKQHPLTKFMTQNYNMNTKNPLSKIYKILTDSTESKDTIRSKWNLELGGQLKEEDWENTYEAIHKTTNSRNWREYAWKVYTRFFITPNIQSKFKISFIPDCWRSCGEKNANHSHIFFFCPLLKSFWQLIITTIMKIFQIKQALESKSIILGISPTEVTSEIDRYLYRILRIAALKQITRNWLKPTPPSFNNWKSTVNNIQEMERITYRIRNQEPEYQRRWNRWSKYMDYN